MIFLLLSLKNKLCLPTLIEKTIWGRLFFTWLVLRAKLIRS
ncbi:hypothetical protein MXB_5588 [Myxobolus squamalis]|nr:hypothetical protein MXB_5588 [Myxobolus squamalis]